MSDNKDGLNVCLMNDSFPPVIDGVANTILNYAEIISSELGKATVVTPDYPNAHDEFPFPVVRYTSMSITEKICSYRMGFPFSASKLDSLASSGFDIIHTHCPFASMAMARVLRIKTGVPMVFTYHTKFDIDIRRALPTKLMQDQAIKMLVGNISAADEVWTVSEGARQNLLSLGYQESEGRRIRIMENGVDFPCGRADPDDAAFLRSELGLEGHGPVFLFVGRLLWYKGIRHILDSLKLLKERGTDFRMMIVGDGADREEIEAYTQELDLTDKVIFTGAIYDREELRVYYTAGDLFIFPSLYDTNGIVVREAAACGVPSVLIKGSCAAEGITHHRTGILVDDTPEAIAEELQFAADHLAEVRQMGDHAMNEVYMSWETSVKNAYARYGEIIENCRSGNTCNYETDLQQDFFSGISKMTDAVQRFRSIPAVSAIRVSNSRSIAKRRAKKEQKKQEEK